MVHYELLLISRSFAQPRQFQLEVSAALDGQQLSKILSASFGSTRWFLGPAALEEAPELSSRTYLLLTDLPRPVLPREHQTPSALQLFVASGPDAGASLRLVQGTHEVGRCAPLWLQDPKIARRHARIRVDQSQLLLTCESSNTLRISPQRSSSEPLSELTLERGTYFWLGDTELCVGDPVMLDNAQSINAEQLHWALPDKPELQRLIALCLAALLPMLSGVMLAVFTGSMLFLLLSGASALLGVFPAIQLLGERRRWKAKAVVYRDHIISARAAYAPPLGISTLAGMARTELQIPTASLPPLVLGQGLWSPAAEEATSKTKRRRKSHTSLDAPCPSPVFSPSVPGAWQIVGAQDKPSTELLFAILARYLPAVLSGRLALVLDPKLRCLPASLLLLPGVSTGLPPLPAAPTTLATKSDGLVRTLYVVSAPAQTRDQAIVIGIGQGPVPSGTWWVNPRTPEAALKDAQLTLHTVQRLSVQRFGRLIDRCLSLAESQAMRGHTKANEITPCDPARALTALIGATDQQEAIILDFGADGPHMLICGTTGSGKSEALRRIVKQLAGEYSPEQVAFALIDFKGGAGLSVFAQLPHVQLFASDLDAAAAQRALAQLEIEVTRREELLAEYRCSDLREYRQLVQPGPALPSLIVVIDEFRVFSDSIPEANPRIDRLAAVGRALGIHLLLSTQRPAGTLTGQTRANLHTVIALRVNDPGESIELVGIPDAASLTNPGQAVIHCATRSTRKFQFALAYDPPPHGELAERGPWDLTAKQVCTFGSLPTAHESMQALHQQIEILAVEWQSFSVRRSPFAEDLPQIPMPPETPWMHAQTEEIWCGLVDRLDSGTLEPLFISGQAGHSLLVCGLPEAGPRQLLSSLCQLPRKVISFGPELLLDGTRFPHLLQVTGQDTYDFLDAVDYLAEPREDEQLLVLIHGVGQLQSLLHPQHFQHLDEVLGALLRQSGLGPTVVIAVDRDQALLKAAGLCTEQWYFPFHATDSLKMAWPRIPVVANHVGRGILLSGTGAALSIQLGTAQSLATTDRQWSGGISEAKKATSPGLLHLGRRALKDTSISLPATAMSIVICADTTIRQDLSQVLCQRWGIERMEKIEDLEALLNCPTAGSIGLVLEHTNDPRLAPLLNSAVSRAVIPVLFAPPSSRLAYEVGAPGMVLDDRCVVVVEAHHPHDLQPLPWEPLGDSKNLDTKNQWRAIASSHGLPRAILIDKEGI
ncbi:FHA domain-containing protein [Glutamicibacter sp.]|uniref:FHA domain-containing protein n=1 Tax=Glutamicibacter sp. TaxID=1931995 RepID=UPI002B499D5D|nr:FtsK/SpoIIIE domain-containing protein [Glutamicibacter sp.]HJX77242.1 FtsK/SpoIIIE domain-containing protein [Glutamicibacter sp.]